MLKKTHRNHPQTLTGIETRMTSLFINVEAYIGTIPKPLQGLKR